MFGGNYFGKPYFGGAPTYIIVPPLGYYPFHCDQTSVIIEKESECETTVMNSQNTNNKTIINSLNNCS